MGKTGTGAKSGAKRIDAVRRERPWAKPASARGALTAFKNAG